MITLKYPKIISVSLTGAVVVAGLQVLIYMLRLNQTMLFLYAALAIYAYLIVKTAFLYDLHYKERGAWARASVRHRDTASSVLRWVRTLLGALADRFRHLAHLRSIAQGLNYLLLPGIIFWSTVAVLYLNMNAASQTNQQVFAALSSVSFIFSYWYLKEIFDRKAERVDSDIFVGMSIVKLYAAFVSFAAMLGLVQRFCLGSGLLTLGVFSICCLLVYQALFQHRLIGLKNILLTLVLSALVAAAAYIVRSMWSLNYITAAIFLTAVYNFVWSIYHSYLDRVLSWRFFLELLLITALVGFMVVGSTNFRERILGAC